MLNNITRVLIVDDDLSQEPIWDVIFRRRPRPVLVEWAVSSEQARKLIREASTQPRKRFDIIVADLFLAGSDTGIEFLQCKEVQSLGAKTILVSAAEKDKLEAHCQKVLPGTKVISKPLNVVKCEKALDEMENTGEDRIWRTN